MWNQSTISLIFIIATFNCHVQPFKQRPKILKDLMNRAQLGKFKEVQLTTETNIKILNGWSTWNEWGLCSKTCGDGKMFRKRLCLLSGFETDFARCNGTGLSIDHKACGNETPCPIRGGWTKWSSWSCSVTCGPGQSVRFRQCTNPVPSNGGEDCRGSSVDEGKCWMVDCPHITYTLSPNTSRRLRERLDEMAYSYVIWKGKRVILPCDRDVSTLVHREFPNAETIWTKNGQSFEIDSFRAWLDDENFVIAYASQEDTGLYECRLLYTRNVYAVISVVFLVVRDKSVRQLYQGEPFQIRCPCSDLSVRYNHVTRRLLLNGYTFSQNRTCIEDDLEMGVAASYHAGEWRCHVTDERNGRIWVTNVFNAKVYPARSSIRKIWDDPRYFIAGVAVWFVFSLILGGVFSHCQKKRLGKALQIREEHEMNPLINDP